jgi:HD-GYP domain-containing protein (c-di-GMP phosphodiesterase class II)
MVAVEELKLGMHVTMPGTWIDHPFLRNSFKLQSMAPVVEMRRHGIRQVMVDFDKSEVESNPLTELAYVSHNDTPADPKDQAPPPIWTPETLIPTHLLEALHDRKLSPEVKAREVYLHSRELMRRLLEAPDMGNLRAAKEAIRSVSETILAEDQTARHLLLITSHDFYTYTHSVNVGVKSLTLAKALFRHSDAHDLRELGAGFFLHDLGKVHVDPATINKPSRLTEEEMRRMRVHPYQGYKMLKQANALTEECRIIVMEHHETMDGKGYPRRLTGDQIHIYGRICCIADVFDALTAERSYKQAMTPFDALTLMRDKMPQHFDRQVFNAFVNIFR